MGASLRPAWPEHHQQRIQETAAEWVEARDRPVPVRGGEQLLEDTRVMLGYDEKVPKNELRRWLRAVGLLQVRLERMPSKDEIDKEVARLRIEDGVERTERGGPKTEAYRRRQETFRSSRTREGEKAFGETHQTGNARKGKPRSSSLPVRSVDEETVHPGRANRKSGSGGTATLRR